MAFEGLTEKLQGALKKMTGRGKLTEQSVKEGMREDKPAAAGSERITQDAGADTIDVQAREAVKQES